jgi:hypothetical protein
MFTLISHWKLHGFGIRLCILIVRFEAQSDAEMADHDYQNQGQLQNRSIHTSKLMTDTFALMFLYINSCGQMMVEEWKHQTSKPIFRGNSKLAFSTREHRRLPFVLDKSSFQTEQSIQYYKRSFTMVAVLRSHVLPPLQVLPVVDVKDLSAPQLHQSRSHTR